MTRAIAVLQMVLPIALCVALGMICRKSGKISRAGIDTLKSVAVDICLPAVLLNAFATADYSLRTLVVPSLMFIVCVAGWALGVMADKLLRLDNDFVPFLTTGFEAGMLGYTLFRTLYGSEATSAFALVDLGQVLFVFTLYKVLLRRKTEHPGNASLIRDMLRSPIIAAIIAGVLLGATGLYRALQPCGVASLIDSCTDLISAPTSVLILIGIGYDLVLKDVRWKEVGWAVLARLLIMAALMLTAMGVVRAIFGEDPALTGAMLIMFILPPPFVLPVFADDPDRRAYVSSALSVTTLLAIALFAGIAAAVV